MSVPAATTSNRSVETPSGQGPPEPDGIHARAGPVVVGAIKHSIAARLAARIPAHPFSTYHRGFRRTAPAGFGPASLLASRGPRGKRETGRHSLDIR